MSKRFKPFPLEKQLDARDCGPACLQMIARHYGRSFSLPELRQKCFQTRQGVSMLGIAQAAEAFGLRADGGLVALEELGREDAPLPFIAFWNQNHFVVVYRIHKDKVYVADPAFGLTTYTKEAFLKSWAVENKAGYGLFLEPTPTFYERELQTSRRGGFRFLWSYFLLYRQMLGQLLLGLLAGSIVALIFPFLTQSLVDIGIGNRDMGFVYAILLAQLALFAGKAAIDVIRSWILLHLGTRISVSLLSDFLIKLVKLPLSFFDSKHLGDLLHRIDDHQRVEEFLTAQTLNLLFSLFNLVVLGLVLLFYSGMVFLIFVVGSLGAILWIALFLKKRKSLDYRNFSQMAEERTNLVQMINGMQEIKLNRCERQKRWQWEAIQAKLFRLKLQSLAVLQYQQNGAMMINELKNILITFVTAHEVINGEMTLGMMLAISFIIGQLNQPIHQMMDFVGAAQDAKLSLARLEEIHGGEEEVAPESETIIHPPEQAGITIDQLTFHYQGAQSEKVLDCVQMNLPHGKVTALVGPSGSGKTTLLKLILKFYKPTTGRILLGDLSLLQLSADAWRARCGAVMQDGFIFNGTIAHNIALSDEFLDSKRLLYSARMANIHEFAESLPLGYGTHIGEDGQGLSMGQRQRILIARAVYKDPDYLFFDEATSSLDANNERAIMDNLNSFYKHRTVLVIAHRLSTVKNADQIVVLNRGRIVETGDHKSLTKKRGFYYQLVKNQLELGL